MSPTIEFVIEQEHPQANELQVACRATGATAIPCTQGAWSSAIAQGQADWVVLVDRQADVSAADVATVSDRISAATSSVWLIPWNRAKSADSSAWSSLPPALAVLWDYPAQSAAICVRRAELSSLPVIPENHPDALWQWLARTALQTKTVAWGGPAGQPDFAGLAMIGARLPALVPSEPSLETKWIVEHISGLKPSQLVSEKKSDADSVAVKAGLLQWHDALNPSHELAQSVEGLGLHQSGDYWHAIMHRREPDYGNAKYWFRQFGSHSIYPDVASAAKTILERLPDGGAWSSKLLARGGWDPHAFVDLCEACAGREATTLGIAARQIQAAEMALLMAATYRDASGK